MITLNQIEKYYFKDKMSVKEMSLLLGCSANTIFYWMNKHGIKRRSISEAVYQKHNPNGDPFTLHKINNIKDSKLLGMGLGLYWGEGTKADKYAVRLGNTDPQLLITFMNFLEVIFGVKRKDMHFGLQIFTDIDSNEALQYWIKVLGVKSTQFYKIHITISESLGTYKRKSKYGVVTVYYHNKKLRDILVGLLPR